MLRPGTCRLIAQPLELFVEKCCQLVFDQPGILAFQNTQCSFEHHFFDNHVLAEPKLQLACDGKEKDISGCHAIDGCDKRHSNTFADLVHIVEMLHDLNET